MIKTNMDKIRLGKKIQKIKVDEILYNYSKNKWQ